MRCYTLVHNKRPSEKSHPPSMPPDTIPSSIPQSPQVPSCTPPSLTLIKEVKHTQVGPPIAQVPAQLEISDVGVYNGNLQQKNEGTDVWMLTKSRA